MTEPVGDGASLTTVIVADLPFAISSSWRSTLPALSHSSHAFNHAESAGMVTTLSRHLSTIIVLSVLTGVSVLLLLQLGAHRAIIAILTVINPIDSFAQLGNFTFKSSHFGL